MLAQVTLHVLTSVTVPIRSAEFAAEMFGYDTDFSMWY